MQPTPKQHTRRSRVLTDPEPEFVSLVKAGANMTPFKAVKADPENTGEQVMPNVRKRTRSAATGLDTQLPHPLQTKTVKADGFMIARIEFAEGQNFPDEAAVKAWLEDGGYENFAISTVDGGWDVVSKSEAEIDGRPSLIQSGDGYSVYVAKLKGHEEPAEEGAEEKAATTGAAVEDLQPVSKTEDAGEEPEADEAEGNADPSAQDGPDTEQLSKAEEAILSRKGTMEMGELGWLLSELKWLTDYGDMNDQAVNAIRNSAGWMLVALSEVTDETLEKFAKDFGLFMEEAAKAAQAEADAKDVPEVAAETSDEGDAEASEKSADGADDAEAVEASEKEADETGEPDANVTEPQGNQLDPEILAKAVAAAISPLAESIAEATKSISELTAKAEATEDRLTEMEASRAPTRKGLGADELNGSPAAPKQPEASKKVQSISLRSSLGFSATGTG